MSAQRIATRYAKSLIDLSIEQGQLKEIYGEMNELSDIMNSNKELARLFKSPVINPDKKLKIVDQVFSGKINTLVFEFINILVRKRREKYLPEIVQSFVDQYNKKNNITNAELVTSIPANESIINQVRNLIQQQTGSTDITIETKVDPSLLGGFVLKFDDKLFDTSLANKLVELKKEFRVNKYIKKF